MAIGDGENDREMLQLAGLGIALANGHKSSKEVADIIGSSNDDDGVASAIYQNACVGVGPTTTLHACAWPAVACTSHTDRWAQY
jgi:hypothetical protein